MSLDEKESRITRLRHGLEKAEAALTELLDNDPHDLTDLRPCQTCRDANDAKHTARRILEREREEGEL